MFERQGYQITFTVLAAAWLMYLGQGLTGAAKTWLYVGMAVAIVHQTYVWLCWRLELLHKSISRSLGAKGFSLYAVGFFLLFASRMVAAIILAFYDQGSIFISKGLQWGSVGLISLLVAYAFYSVARYFGMKRATGADHFFEEYRTMPFVKEGMFRFSSNVMYTYGTLIILLPGLIAESYFALLLGVFNYVYVWVHYFCLEKPDIKRIYGA